jgi:hypothetical protein
MGKVPVGSNPVDSNCLLAILLAENQIARGIVREIAMLRQARSGGARRLALPHAR